MKNRWYSLLLYILRAFVYIKRAVFFFSRYAWHLFGRLYDAYSNSIGFRLYKLFFIIKRKAQKYKIPLDKRIVELLARRGTLQVLLFIFIIIIIFPDSKLYSKELNRIPGRETLLYELVGPGEQDFSLDDIVIEEADYARANADVPTWREGALGAETLPTPNTEITRSPQDIGGISVGGSAITKPTILPGSDIPTIEDVPNTPSAGQRDDTVQYTVQPGDVIGAIAQNFGVSVNTILWANDLSVRSYIQPGDVLKIPPQSGVYHTVKRGETLLAIANEYDAEAGDIIAFNKMEQNGADIVVGEELFIPGGSRTVQVAPTRAPVQTPTIVRQVAAPPPSVEAPAGSGYIWPTNVRTITQYFGWRHTGVDIAGPVGSPLYAARAGTVITSQCGWNGGYGCYVILDHGGGITTLYAHASQLNVSVGDAVNQGDVLALMGSTGRSTGPHIHFEVRVSGSRQNPLKYVR